MPLPDVQLRLSCAFCSMRKLVGLAELKAGCFRCSMCERISGVDVEELRRCVADLVAVVAAMTAVSPAPNRD